MESKRIGTFLIDFNQNDKLVNQLNFIIEIDKVKHIFRQSKLFNSERLENDAEHSWTISIMCILLKEYADFEVNIEKVISMLLIHDIVEIDTGDTFLYSSQRDESYNNEKKAADRIFGLLEPDQKKYFLSLWEEFEERKPHEAKFASVFDRLEPIIQNYMSEGYSWKKNNITYDMVINKNMHIKDGSEKIWNFVLQLLEKAVEKGYLIK